MNAKLSFTFRLALAVLLAVMMALGIPTGTARAGGECPAGQSAAIGIQGGTPGAVLTVTTDSGKSHTVTLDQNGNGSVTIPGPVVITRISGGKPGMKSTFDCISGKSGAQSPPRPHLANSAGNAPYSGNTNDPISTATGEYHFDLPLLDLGGPMSLRFALHYGSVMGKFSGGDPFGGDPFVHNYQFAIGRTSDTALVVLLDNGNQINFQKSGNQWQVTREEVIYQLQESDKRYYLLDPIAERVYTFDKFPGTTGTPMAFLTHIQDRNGNALTFTNDNTGLPTRVEDGLGRALTFTYANPSEDWIYPHLVQVSDSFNRTLKFTYQTTSEPVLMTHLTRVTDALGGTTVFTHTGPLTNTVIASVMYPRGNVPYTQKYDQLPSGVWRATEQKDAAGNATRLSFDAAGNATITDALGNAMQHTHKDGYRLDAQKDAAGKTTTLAYDANGRRTAIVDRMGDTTKFMYHAPTGKLASITNARGDTITYTYTAQEQTIGEARFTFYNLTRVDYPDKTSAQYTYDARGNVVTMIDGAGQTWKYTHSERGWLTTLTNPAGGVATYAYNADGTLASRKDSETGETKYAYDAMKRFAKITRADNTAIQFAYDANDRLIAYTDANGKTTKYEYDANGNLVKVTDAAGQTFGLSYDAMDRIVRMTDRLGTASTFEYDKSGRAAVFMDATGIAAQFGYDARGWVNRITLGGEAWQIGYDDEGVPIAYTSPSGDVTKLQRDKLGALVGATNALNQATTLTRDALGRITGTTDALNRTTNYAYDARSLLTGVTLPEVGATKYEYDALGNLTKIADLNGAEWKFVYTPMGRSKSTTDPVGQIANLTYDARGRLAQVAHADPSTSSGQATQALTYDAAGNLTQSKYSDGTDLKFAYDALNRLIEANGVKFTRDAEGRITNSENASAGYGATYDDAGRLKTVTYTGGLTVTYTYDAKTGLLASVSDSLTKTQIDFTYDKDRQLVGIARSNNVNTTLTWDRAGHLTGLGDLSGVNTIVDAQYTLDAAGQVTQSKITAPLDPSAALVGATTQGSPLQYDAASQISSAGYKYDARGRLTQSPNHQFSWDGASRLVSVDSTKLTYNGLGDVASRTEGNTTTTYAYNYALGLDPIVAEFASPALPSASAPLRYYIWSPGGQLLYMIDAADANKVYHYHFDRVGSTLALTDANGAVTDAYAYDPYGKLVARTGKNAQPFTFVGAWGVRQEGASGALYQMRARYYDATTARFISREPIGPNIADPFPINPYQYVTNDPLGKVDVTGLQECKPGSPGGRWVMRVHSYSDGQSIDKDYEMGQVLPFIESGWMYPVWVCGYAQAGAAPGAAPGGGPLGGSAGIPWPRVPPAVNFGVVPPRGGIANPKAPPPILNYPIPTRVTSPPPGARAGAARANLPGAAPGAQAGAAPGAAPGRGPSGGGALTAGRGLPPAVNFGVVPPKGGIANPKAPPPILNYPIPAAATSGAPGAGYSGHVGTRGSAAKFEPWRNIMWTPPFIPDAMVEAASDALDMGR